MLCTDEEVLGALPPLPVAAPWWPEAWDVVATVKQTYDLDVTVLRLLEASIPRMPGGVVTYLAEVSQRPEIPLAPWSGDPLGRPPPPPVLGPTRRSPAARGLGPGSARRRRHRLDRRSGPGQDLESVDALAAAHRARQRLAEGRAGLLRPRGRDHVSSSVRPVTPALYAAEPGRILMAEVAGDNHETTGPALAPMVDILTGIQSDWIGRTDELLALGLPDRRLAAMRSADREGGRGPPRRDPAGGPGRSLCARRDPRRPDQGHRRLRGA